MPWEDAEAPGGEVGAYVPEGVGGAPGSWWGPGEELCSGRSGLQAHFLLCPWGLQGFSARGRQAGRPLAVGTALPRASVCPPAPSGKPWEVQALGSHRLLGLQDQQRVGMEPSQTPTQPRGFGLNLLCDGGSRAEMLESWWEGGAWRGGQLAGGCLTGQALWGLSLG